MKEIFKNYLVTEFAEDYSEGQITRRQALKLIGGVTGSILIASSILAACAAPPETATPALSNTRGPGSATPASAAAAQAPQSPPAGATPPGSPDVQAEAVTFPGEDGATLSGYLAYPTGADQRPLILVCHENRGLTAHIQDVTRRLAQAGYAALAVDLLSRSGGTAAVGSDNVPGVLGNTDPAQFVTDFRSGWKYAGGLSFTLPERLGMVGFCFGGGVTWLMTTQMPELKAAVPFYGPHPPLEDVPNIRAAVRAIYAGEDQRINAGIPAIETAMQQNNKVFEKIVYPGVQHAFHNDTSDRYNQPAAQDAWAKTLEWFSRWV